MEPLFQIIIFVFITLGSFMVFNYYHKIVAYIKAPDPEEKLKIINNRWKVYTGFFFIMFGLILLGQSIVSAFL